MPFDLGQIGRALKAAREEKGLAPEDVTRALCIRKGTIRAIEAGEWENLPHPVYVKGYVTQYASFLNILDAVKPALTEKEPPPPEKERREAPAPREEMRLGRDTRKKIAGGVLVACVLVAFLVFLNVQRPAGVAPPTHAAGQPEQQAAEADRQAGPPAGQAQETQRPIQAVEGGYQTVAGADRTGERKDAQAEIVLDRKKLMIACQERTWVSILIDGSEKKEFILNPEEVVVITAKEKFDLLIGNAAGVKLFYNGKDVGLTGESGEVKRVNLS